MKKSIIKKISCYLISTITFCCINPYSTFADNNELCKKDPQYAYAEDTIVTYLKSYNVNNNEIYLSEPYNVYNLNEEKESNDVYIVFENDNIIGMLTVTDVDGEYYSSFEYNSFEPLQELFEKNIPFSFVSYDESLYVENKCAAYNVYNDNKIISYDFTITTEAELEKSHKITKVRDTNSIQSYIYKKNLTVPIVQNEVINNLGVCWAAAIASKVDFINNDTLIASDVYEDLDAAYFGDPIGIPLWVQRGYNYYNISCTTLYRMLDCVEVYNNILNDNPIDISVTDTSAYHDVLISGITVNTDGSGIYRLVDSNRVSYVDVIVPADVMTADDDFVYATNYGYTFTSWCRTYY